MRGQRNSVGMLVLFLITGAVIGGILGEVLSGVKALSGITPYVTKTFPVFDMQPVTVNLYVLKLVFGLSLHPNLISIAGMVMAALLFRKF